MRDIVLTLLVFGTLPIILVKPWVGVLVFSWLSYMNPHRLTWGFAYDFRFVLIVGAATVFGWLISREAKRIPLSVTTILLIAFGLWASFTTIFALYPSQAQSYWEDRFAKILLFNGVVTLALMGSRRRIEALIWVIVVSIGFYAFKGGIFTLITGGDYRVWGPANSFISDNNDLGLALVMTLPLMRYLQQTAIRRIVHVGLGIGMALTILTILGTYSRGAFLGLAVLVGMLFLKTKRRIFTGFLFCAILLLSFNFMPESWHARMQTITSFSEDPSIQARLNAWAYAIELALERPIMGGGFEAFRGHETEFGRYRVAHSIYFQVLGEHGFVGLALYLALGASALLTGTAIRRQTRGQPELAWAHDLASMLQVSLITFAASGAFLSRAYFDLYFHIMVMMVLTGAVVNYKLRTEAEELTGNDKSFRDVYPTKA